ncbi:MAG: TonB family protein, partial [Elusimicrobiales bacterium]
TNTRNIKPSMAYEKSTIIDEDKSAYNITTYNSTSSSASSEIKTDKDFPYPYYITRLREVLFDSWKSKNVSATNISAIVKFRIYPNGEIRNISIEKSSSNNLFDYSVLSAVSEIKKVDPLPADFFEDYLTVYVEFKAVK